MPRGFDSEAHLYDQRRGPTDPREVEALIRVFEGRGSILDVGGGTGRFALPLESGGHTVTIADLSRGMLLHAKAKSLTRLVHANAAQLPFRDAAFDGAFFVFLIHLIDDWASAVREIGRVTKGPVAALRTDRDPDLRSLYLETRSAMGHPTGRFDRGVRGLTELIPPSEVIEVSLNRREVDAMEQFAGYEKPEGAPPGVHAAALELVVSQNGSRRVAVVEEIRVVVWPAGAFARFTPKSS